MALIAAGEDLLVEFKRAAIAPRDFAKTLVALANSDGGIILVGVEDDGVVSGIEHHAKNVAKLREVPRAQCRPQDPPLAVRLLDVDGIRGHTVLVAQVRPGDDLYYTQDNVAYVRDYDARGRPCDRPLSPEESASLLLSRRQISFEATKERRAHLDDLDVRLISNYAAKRGASEPWQDFLHGEGLLEEERHGGLIPTNACILLFSRNPTRFLDRCDIDFARYEGTEARVGRELNVIKRRSFEGALPALIDDCFSFLRDQIKERAPLTGLTFAELPEYPELAWQEAVINAVAHRDYRLKGMPIFVRMFDDRLEIESPGPVVPPNSIDGIRQGRYSHYSRNPRIVRVLYELGYMRRLAEGIRRMTEEMERSDLNPPEFTQPNHSFLVTLWNRPLFRPETRAWLARFGAVPLTDRQRRGLAYLYQNGRLTNALYRQINSRVARELAAADLRNMVHMGLLSRLGTGRGIHYELSPRIGEMVHVEIPPGREARLIRYLTEEGSISNREYRRLFDVNSNVALRELRELVKRRVLVMRGKRRGTRYYLPTSQKTL